MHAKIKIELQKLATPKRAKVSASFFKTKKGQYGEGDIFIGITVPDARIVAKKYQNIDSNSIKSLLESKIHEHRLVALLILVEQFKIANKEAQKEIIDFYLNHTKYINNWDLVDLSADKILGSFLLDKDTTLLKSLAQSQNLWERRIAIVATFAFIKQNRFEKTFEISKLLLNDSHDLIHKAVGWMLREVGKRNEQIEEQFLKQYFKQMPRTMLRYAIERFVKEKRELYMKK